MSTWEATVWDPRLNLAAAHMHASTSCMALKVNLQAHGSMSHHRRRSLIYSTGCLSLSPWQQQDPHFSRRVQDVCIHRRQCRSSDDCKKLTCLW